jgi:hypothetical protein
MDYLTIEVKIPKEASEVFDSIIDLVAAVKKAGADGIGVEDISALTAPAIKVVSEVSDYDLITKEIKSDPEAAANLAALTGARLLKALGLF